MPNAAQAAVSWERWQAATRSINGGFETRLSGSPASFRGAIQRFSAMGLSYASIETNARSLYRGKSHAPGSERHYCLVYQARGRSLARQGAQIAMLNQADMVLLSPHEDCEFINRGMIRHLSFNIPEPVLTRALDTDQIPLAIPIRSQSPVGALLSALLMQVHSRSAELSLLTGRSLDSAMAFLIAPLVADAGARDDAEGELPEIVSTLTVMRFVDANLRNPNLSPGYVAKALGCSARHVHRAFEGAGLTVSAYIKRQRLREAARELTGGENRGDSVTEIAMRWGFSEISHFSRCFRAEFGLAPRDFRERAQAMAAE